MKNVLFFVVLVSCFGCATQKQFGAVGGSRSDGTVKLAYQYEAYESPVVDRAQALKIATAKCQSWGYGSAEAFGVAVTTCSTANAFGCVQYVVTDEYQCKNN